MINTNNHDFDTLTIYVKKSKAVEIIENYKSFGWYLELEKENSSYEDIVDITFKRKHKIKNKDELQLMQIYMEDKLNSLGKLERNKTPKTTAFGLFFGIIGITLIIIGILFATKVFYGISLFVNIFLLVIGALFLIITISILPKLNKSEMISFEKNSSLLKTEIQDICSQASKLFGGDKDEK